MQKYSDVVLDKNGKPVQGAVVTVVTYPDGQPATIYAADGGPAVDSVKTDQTGVFSFYAGNGRYSFTVSGNGISPITINDVLLFDPRMNAEALPEWFGAKGNGADDTAAVQAAMNTGKYKLINQYTITSKVTAPANSIGTGPGSLIKGANCDMVELKDGAKMTGISLVGIGQLYTGRGVIITGGADQRLRDCNITGMDGYCVEYTASQAGLRGSIDGGKYQRYVTTNPAIKYPTSETNGDRRLLNVDCAGGILCDLSGSATTMISGCDTTGVTFSSGTQKAILNGNRIATMGGVMTVLGVDGVIQGNCIAGDLIAGASAQNNTISGNVLAAGYAVRDQSGNAANFIDTLGEDFTPIWAASGTAPSLGNGSISGRLTRRGKRVFIDIELSFGSTTTYGTGVWQFSLPAAYSNLTVKKAKASAVMSLKSGSAFHTGVSTAPAGGAPVITLYSENGGNSWGPTIPVTWGSGDYIRFSLDYEIG